MKPLKNQGKVPIRPEKTNQILKGMNKDSVLPSQLLEAKKSSRKISPVGASRDFDAPNNSLSPTNQLEPLTRLFC